MEFINVGAFVDNLRPKTKKALKDAIASSPDSVKFDGTAMFGPPGPFVISQIEPGQKLSVVGPDPYNNRKWYATVSRNPKGNITVQ